MGILATIVILSTVLQEKVSSSQLEVLLLAMLVYSCFSKYKTDATLPSIAAPQTSFFLKHIKQSSLRVHVLVLGPLWLFCMFTAEFP